SRNPTLPGLQHVRHCFPFRLHNGALGGFSLDIEAAHKTVRIREKDRGLLGVQHDGTLRYLFYRVCPFGAVFSAHWFQRVNAFLIRMLHPFLYVRHALYMYSDDLLGITEQSVLDITFALVLAFCVCFGYPVSWKKLQMGSQIIWIGWSFAFGAGCVEVPSDKTAKLLVGLRDLLKQERVDKRELHRVIGLIQWILQLFPLLKPWMNTLYFDLHSPLGTNYSMDPGGHLDDALVSSGTAIPLGSKLLSVRHVDIKRKCVLAQANFKELQGRGDEFIEEEEKAREEYAKYFDEQEKLKEELRQDRDRLLEKELRMEGHRGPRTSTSPTRKEEGEEDLSEYNDRGYFEKLQEEEEAQEAMEENENEYYTQSYEISEEEAGEAWTEESEEGEATGPEEPKEEEEEGKPKRKETQEEYDEERKRLLAKARADIAQKEAKRKEQEKGFKPPVDKSQEYKYYSEGGHIYRQSHKTGEKIWWNYDYKYKHQKGKGKEAYEKAGKGSRPHQPFQPRDEEDKAYWANMDEEVK
ncbi:unnamed protein product, partial [Symbiodinium sp. CCMP2456]